MGLRGKNDVCLGGATTLETGPNNKGHDEEEKDWRVGGAEPGSQREGINQDGTSVITASNANSHNCSGAYLCVAGLITKPAEVGRGERIRGLLG